MEARAHPACASARRDQRRRHRRRAPIQTRTYPENLIASIDYIELILKKNSFLYIQISKKNVFNALINSFKSQSKINTVFTYLF